jgi:hypothetical protein
VCKGFLEEDCVLLVLTGNCSLIGSEDLVGLGDRELVDVYGCASSILDRDRWPMFAMT